MRNLILAALLLGVVSILSACASGFLADNNPWKWACHAIDGKFDPATGNCDKNIFG